MTDLSPMTRYLGKLPYVNDPRSVRFDVYSSGLPLPPTSKDWAGKVKNWPMFLNDKLGDCTIAAVAHMIENWTANATIEALLSDAEVLKAYCVLSGYDPATGANDNGCYINQVLSYWHNKGICGELNVVYAEINPADTRSMQQSIDITGAVDIGLALPIACQSMGTTWTNPPAGWQDNPDWQPGSWGGHSIPLLGYTPGDWVGISWAEVITIEAGFAAAYMDEAWSVFSHGWLEKDGKSPSGFNATQLVADVKAIHAQSPVPTQSLVRPAPGGWKLGC